LWPTTGAFGRRCFPALFRVIGATRNVDAWYGAFDVKPGETPDQRVGL
jgi:predicted metalloendopeptidase